MYGYLTQIDYNKGIQYLTQAANNNMKLSQYHLYQIYSTDKYHMKDNSKAIHYLIMAAQENNLVFHNINVKVENTDCNINSFVKTNIRMYNTQEQETAQAKSQYILGCLYLKGEKIQKDIDKGIYYLTLSANKEYLDSELMLSKIYIEGVLVKKDPYKCLYYMRKAAKKHSPEAQMNLGMMYYFGEYVQRDINKAIDYLILAGNQNISKAWLLLTVLSSLSSLNSTTIF